jgi:hypothetical protein
MWDFWFENKPSGNPDSVSAKRQEIIWKTISLVAAETSSENVDSIFLRSR